MIPLIARHTKPIRPAILLIQPLLPVRQPPCHTPRALRAVRAVKERDMLISDVLEPMYLTRILKQSQGDGMYRRITPALVEETSRPVQVLEVSFVGFRAPEIHIGDFEVGPEVAGRVAVGFVLMVWPPVAVGEELVGVVGVQVLIVARHELHRLGPEGSDTLRGVVERDGEAVRFVVVAHVAEDVVVDVAEEVYVGLHAPVVLVF